MTYTYITTEHTIKLGHVIDGLEVVSVECTSPGMFEDTYKVGLAEVEYEFHGNGD